MKKYAREAAGSGIPQTKSAYYNHGGHISAASGIWRWLLGMIYIGLGTAWAARVPPSISVRPLPPAPPAGLSVTRNGRGP
ncbi:MAG: hypothetical protein R3F31_27690 [Verrucomicrobiales bacterium]